MSIAGLNCNGNPLHPDPVIGDKHAEDIRRSIRLANRLGQTPGGHHVRPARRRARVDHAQLGRQRLELRRRWMSWTTSGSVAAPFWKETDALAADLDVKVALELHPQNLVFNTADVASWSS